MGFEPMTTCVSDRYSKPTELPSYIWKEKDSNLHRAGLQPAALPLELSFQKENHLSLSDKWFSNVQSIVTYLHIAQFKRSTISDKDITKSPVFVIKTNLNIPLYLLKLSHHSCRSHCFCSPLLNIFYSLSRLKTSDSNCASCSQGKRATITPRSQGEREKCLFSPTLYYY